MSSNIINPEESNFRDKYLKSGKTGTALISRFYAEIKNLVQHHTGDMKTALEVGIGEGFSTQRITPMFRAGVHFEASEYRDDLVEVARERNPGIPIYQESIYTLNRADKSSDLVICLEVLEHLEDPALALQELARVAREFVIVSVPREPIWRMLNIMRGKYLGSFGNTPGHIQHWSTHSFCSFVSRWYQVSAVRTPVPWTILLLKPKRQPT